MMFAPLAPLALVALASAAASPTMSVDVDARDIAKRIVHSKVTLPAAPSSSNVFLYPKWIPGEHAPDGPVAGVVNLHFFAGGTNKELPWSRDTVEMFAFHIDVPAGVTSVEARFDFVTPTDGGTFSGSSMGTDSVGIISFNQLVLTPDKAKSDDVVVNAKLTVPKGWGAGTALPGKRAGDTFTFAPASLTTVVDSPVNMARYFKRFELDATHAVDVAADSESALAVSNDTITEWKQLVAEAGALFGVRHYRRYEFLVTLSDHVDDFGLEHHESSDNRFSERGYTDDDKRLFYAGLLPHEYVHSWNGKYRRPAGLATGDYEAPMNSEMLWVYEGLTEYLGYVLAARSGLQSLEEANDSLAFEVAGMDVTGGRTWRPLVDTAVAAQILYGAPRQWESARRSVDFYDEGVLLWLEVDTKIRALTNGAKSLDDFCRAFHGGAGAGGKPELLPYTFDDLVKALNDVAGFDWKAFLDERLKKTSAHAPYGGLEAAGWKIAYSDEAGGFIKAREGERKLVDERFAIGFVLSAEDNTVNDVVPGSAAWNAGVTPGMKLAGVNGRKFSKELLDDVLKASTTSKAPIELLLENTEVYRTVKVDYHGGKRYPTLARDDKKPDIWAKIVAPRTPHAARTDSKKK